MTKIWQIVKGTVYGFIEDEALTRGAAIAFYTATSIAPVLLIAISIAAVAFGQDAAQEQITTQLGGLMGDQAAQLLQTAVANASSKSSGTVATVVGLGPVAGLVGIEGGVVSGVFNLESPGVRAPGRRPRHDQRYHEA
jgi:membrane protein